MINMTRVFKIDSYLADDWLFMWSMLTYPGDVQITCRNIATLAPKGLS